MIARVSFPRRPLASVTFGAARQPARRILRRSLPAVKGRRPAISNRTIGVGLPWCCSPFSRAPILTFRQAQRGGTGEGRRIGLWRPLACPRNGIRSPARPQGGQSREPSIPGRTHTPSSWNRMKGTRGCNAFHFLVPEHPLDRFSRCWEGSPATGFRPQPRARDRRRVWGRGQGKLDFGLRRPLGWWD